MLNLTNITFWISGRFINTTWLHPRLSSLLHQFTAGLADVLQVPERDVHDRRPDPGGPHRRRAWVPGVGQRRGRDSVPQLQLELLAEVEKVVRSEIVTGSKERRSGDLGSFDRRRRIQNRSNGFEQTLLKVPISSHIFCIDSSKKLDPGPDLGSRGP